jgi:hypothetical protein
MGIASGKVQRWLPHDAEYTVGIASAERDGPAGLAPFIYPYRDGYTSVSRAPPPHAGRLRPRA